ncbi:MAG: M48 family metallopeptidase [Proteobacteria bacterium]|nr:M48 family metallopeptidase [Pseudomonadota bacterium]
MQQLLFDWLGIDATTAISKPNRPTAPVPPAQAAPEVEASQAPPALDLHQALAPARFSHPQANRSIVLGDAHVAYPFRRGARRTIGLSVGPEGLTVAAPRWTPLAEVEALLRQKSRWVLDKLSQSRERGAAEALARIDWREGASVPFLGQPLVLRLDPRQRHGPGGAGAVRDGATLWLGLPQGAAPERLRDTTQAWLIGQARRLFAARLDHFAPQLGVRWQRLTLTAARTRWGSASADGSIRLNWRLIHLSEALIDYVAVHELAHLREMNHSARFWEHVGEVLPDYAQRRGTLKHERVPAW